MATTTPLKKSRYMIKWIPQADTPRKASEGIKMNGLSLILSLNKMK